jgi:hypothetical protein
MHRQVALLLEWNSVIAESQLAQGLEASAIDGHDLCVLAGYLASNPST